MNKEQIKGKLDQVKGEGKEQWGKLTDDHSKEAEGKMDKVKGKLKEGYGDVKEKLSEKDDKVE
ncbi:CsbD family protein [Neobacillus sp. NPDC058068]|uniref:CsbD family protein n=1 Tax=Neobacillus sp. NPDC058068 TaxID=3346325 RepID=UPI0036D78FEA